MLNKKNQPLFWIMLAAFAALYFIPLGSRALWNSDEGRYAEIAREMLELKDWITPHLNYVVYLEKPPLMYWLTAISMALFGQNEFAARLWCALFGLLTLGVVYLLGTSWKSERVGLLAAAMTGTSLLFFGATQYIVLDLALTFWLTLALYALTRILQERPPERVRRFADLLAIAVAGGFLTKGLVALLIPTVVFAGTVFFTRMQVQTRKISWQPVAILFVFLVAPWFVFVTLKNPYFPQFFFVREHFSRFLTTVHHRNAPFYFFVPVLVGGFLPWSFFLPTVFLSAFKSRALQLKQDPVRALLVFWSLFVFAFFSVSHSKLAGYLLPLFPALGLLVASAFEGVQEGERFPGWMAGGLAGLIGVYSILLIVLKSPLAAPLWKDPMAALVRANSDGLSLVLSCGVFILVGVWGMRRRGACLTGLFGVQILLLATISAIAPVLDPYLSNSGLSRILVARAAAHEPIVAYGLSYEDEMQSVPFYTKRRIVVQGKVGELELGRTHASDAADWFWIDPGAHDAFRQTPPGAWIVTSDDAIPYLRQAGWLNTHEIVGHEGTLTLLRKKR